jgi:hypothetical protein
VTYIWTQEGWLYLYVVIDLCFQKVDGWSMSSHMKVQLLCDALQMVIWQRRQDARFSLPFRQRVTICHQGIYTVANTTRHLKVVWVARAAVGMPCERYTAGYWYLDLGVALIASGEPLRPSTEAISMYCIPQFFRSINTYSQNFAPSFYGVHMPRTR